MMTAEVTRAAPIFNGSFTIENNNTHEHRTYEIWTMPDDAKFAPGKRIVSMLTGTYSQTAFGFVTNEQINVWRRKQGPEKWSEWQWYAHMLWHIATKEPSTVFNIDNYQLLHSEHCLICNRKLTNPESIKTGIGPVCAKRI